MPHTLFLASGSRSRKQLLTEAAIPFTIISHTADEKVDDPTLPLADIVSALAVQKMESVVLPEHIEQETIFILTADSLVRGPDGTIYGKPRDKADAVRMLQAHETGHMSTGFCIERRVKKAGQWVVEKRIVQAVNADFQCSVPDQWIEPYFKHVPYYMTAASALNIEGFGAQFVKTINGSYTTVLGLPIFEVREALEQIGFFEK